MATSIFDNKSAQPTGELLAIELGNAKEYLNKIGLFIINEYGDLSPEWKFYGQKSGWILKMLSGKRNLLFIIPLKNHFTVNIVFGDKAVEEVMQSNLPDSIKQELQSAQKYVEGRSVQVDVKTEQDEKNVLELIKIKMRN
jgi:hypothetical protein